MSHSRIYQLDREPIPKDDWLTEYDLDYSQVRSEIPLMDWYIDSESGRKYDMEFLKRAAESLGMTVDENAETLTFTGDYAFEGEMARRIKEAAARRDFWEVRQLATGFRMTDIYVYCEEDGYPINLAMWASDNIGLIEPGTVFHVGGIIDYHY